MNTVFLTDTGKVREHNEDAGGVFVNKTGDYLAVVADGMGGHQAGDVASQMTTDMLRESFEGLNETLTPDKAGKWLERAFQEINEKVFEQAGKNRHLQGMGTTLVAVVCTRSFIVITHVGDSRAYLWTDQELQLKTEDHSLVNELKKSGQLTAQEADNHPQKNILTRALGTEVSLKSEQTVLEWKKGDAVVLCSDGLTNKVTDNEIEQTLSQQSSLREQAEHLVHMAKDRGGEDNITLAVVENIPLEEGLM
ncbi:protein phosphatase [Alteribacillus persepolensis]|uniref:protein-serine/threonine phosphatase n=1 Tax=Alteribacillus persepolensis TaxID=568899 RepID=A0A1G7YII4_9BACI|nr:Stp1/IreP family PP2C-type Ser/Thr phosphatase [Alteribacillus persepolensis]SDG96372.1 protein phosphatase [Alteribacillus persepolensis]